MRRISGQVYTVLWLALLGPPIGGVFAAFYMLEGKELVYGFLIMFVLGYFIGIVPSIVAASLYVTVLTVWPLLKPKLVARAVVAALIALCVGFCWFYWYEYASVDKPVTWPILSTYASFAAIPAFVLALWFPRNEGPVAF